MRTTQNLLKMKMVFVLFAVCFLLFSAGYAREKVVVKVKVVDYANGKPIKKAILSFKQVAIDTIYSACPDIESDSKGIATCKLQPGLYTVSAWHLYYKAITFDIYVSAGDINDITVQLKLDPGSFAPASLSREEEKELTEKIGHIRESNFGNAKDWGDSWILDERGRVFLDYGSPDEVTSQPDMSLELYTKGRIYSAVEIWLYYTGGHSGMQSIYDNPHFGKTWFVFVDKEGYGKFVLLDSSALGEVSDPRVYQNRTFN